MDNTITQRLLRFGWKLPYLRLLSSRKTVILEYHGVPKNGNGNYIGSGVFEQHILFLKQYFELVSPERFGERHNSHQRVSVLLTFDDGFRNHAEVVAPILRKHKVPAIFFVCSRHATPGKYLWFAYLSALEKHFRGNGFYFRGEFINMSPGQREKNMQRLREFLLSLRPHPAEMYRVIEEELPQLQDFLNWDDLENFYGGMTIEQVGELASDQLFTIGVHTLDHPFLTRCDANEAFRQIVKSKDWIEQISQRKCDAIAYPGGDYNLEILKKCHQLNFARGYVERSIGAGIPHLEEPRIGIYSTSLDALGFKVQWGNLMRALKIKVG